MANIASGYVSITFAQPTESVADELTTLIHEHPAFNYGGDSFDVGGGEDGIEGGFSCRWTGDDCWDWIDASMSSGSTLSDEAKAALIAATIDGYSYEWSCNHRDRVEKKSGATTLTRFDSTYGDLDLAGALAQLGALALGLNERKKVGNDVIIEVADITVEDDVVTKVYEICGDVECALTLSFAAADDTFKLPDFVKFVDDDGEEFDEMPDIDEFYAMNELLDDMLCDEDDLFVQKS